MVSMLRDAFRRMMNLLADTSIMGSKVDKSRHYRTSYEYADKAMVQEGARSQKKQEITRNIADTLTKQWFKLGARSKKAELGGSI